MQKETTIKDDRGTIQIRVTLHVFNFGQTDLQGNAYRYDVTVFHTPKGKRKSFPCKDIATKEEISQAKLSIWESIKPY